MIRIGVLISGEGTNLQAIIDQANGWEVGLVISNREGVHGLERAKRHKIPSLVVRLSDFPSREAFDEGLIRELDKAHVDLVALAGFMIVLGKKFVSHFRGRLMNIHPALLPAFPGTDAIEKAFQYGVKATGVTVHFVDEGVDTGPIILQETINVSDKETLETLAEKIHQREHTLYPKAIRLYAEGRLRIRGRRVIIKEPGL
ncbi:MAG: phosphoribosylglycinamide formyltransferase [Deltaproteobacteria bacterium]|nr:phosphoribosylglycinamide formyltransferase [Deltaproteobacteria bacterium]MBI4374706.1 phosphoribosylglycinamide formyltransferase [Deltaproteobacteria bacterium]